MDWEDIGKFRQTFWRAIEKVFNKHVRRFIAMMTGRDVFRGDERNYEFAHGLHKSDRISLVNHLIKINQYQSYLEIGVRDKNAMFQNIDAHESTSVDPDPKANADHCLPSDEFFLRNQSTFDIIFIDGNHTGDQVERDIQNSLNCLSPKGVILLHDMNPPTVFHAREQYEIGGRHPSWNGTSWKGYAAFRASRDDLTMSVVDTDWGVGIIHSGLQRKINCRYEAYSDLSANRQELLNLITVPEFLRRYSDPF